MDCGQCVADGDARKLLTMCSKEGVRRDEQPAGLKLAQRRRHCIEISFATSVQDMQPHSQRTRCGLQVAQLRFCSWASWIEKNCNHRSHRHRFVQNFQSL